MEINEIESYISKIPDFPKPGILFYDISTLLSNADAFTSSINLLGKAASKFNFDLIGGVDARGFIFSAALSYSLNIPLLMIRKKNKLPGKTYSIEYDLEYGQDTLEININVNKKKVLLIDDLLATGGTINAAASLLQKSGAEVCCFISLIELTFLNGREKLNFPYQTLIKY